MSNRKMNEIKHISRIKYSEKTTDIKSIKMIMIKLTLVMQCSLEL